MDLIFLMFISLEMKEIEETYRRKFEGFFF